MIVNNYLSNNRIYLVDVSTTGHSIEMLSEVLECLKVMLRKFVNESLQLQHSHLEILCAICINEVLIECYITKTSDVLSAVFYMKNMVTIYIISIHKGMIITHEYYVSILLSTCIQSFNSLHQYYVYSLIWVYALLQTIMNLIIKKQLLSNSKLHVLAVIKIDIMHDLKYMSLFKSSLEYKIVTKVQHQTFHASSPSGFIKI